MRVKLPIRLSLAGMAGLALLSATHWARGAFPHPSSAVAFALGVMPNFAASLAMPLVLASMLPSVSAEPPTPLAKRQFLLLLLFTTVGLCAWELVQTQSARFVFDVNDIAATVIGAAFALIIYLIATPSSGNGRAPSSREA